MTPNEVMVYVGSKLRDLIESRIVYGPDDDLMEDIEAAYEEFKDADYDECVEVESEEDTLNN